MIVRTYITKLITNHEGNKYGVNGNAQNDYRTIFDITKEAENLGVKFKMNVTPLIEAGSKLYKIKKSPFELSLYIK